MSRQRRAFSAEFKFRVALEAAQGTKTVSQLASEYGVHPTQVSTWKAQLLDEGAQLFSAKGQGPSRQAAQTETELYEQIGRLKMELEWLKKKAAHLGNGAARHD